MESIQVGPLAFPVALGILVAAVLTALLTGKFVRKIGVDPEPAVWTVFLAGAVAARVAFVVMFWQSYALRPWSALDFRDGGFDIAVGVMVGLLAAALLAFRTVPLRKPLFYSLTAALVVWGTLTALVGSGRDGVGLPQLALADLDGGIVPMESFAGRPVVVNLWATWCPPCRREMPVFRDAQQANKDVAFVFANQGESAAQVRAFLDSQGLALENVLLDPEGRLAKAMGSAAMPTTLFFDRQGRLVSTRVGEVSAATLAQRMEGLREKR
jgi:thiol-disulfide isomerase/thioredoxin